MRNKKWRLFAGLIVIIVGVLGGCGKTETAYADQQKQDNTEISVSSDEVKEGEIEKIEESKKIQKTEEKELIEQNEVSDEGMEEKSTKFSFADVSNLEFWFGSGAGAWCTTLTIYEDGTFVGQYHDSDMGDTGEEYPNGIIYLCDFVGKFTEPEKVNDYTYASTIDHIRWERVAQTEEVKDGIKYIYSKPYGIDEAERILFYLPGSPVEELPEDYMEWVRYSAFSQGEKAELSFYGLYNEKMEYGFSSYEVAKTAIDEEIVKIVQEENRLMKDFDLKPQQEMNRACYEVYQLWDNELNSIWERLKRSLDQETIKALTTEEREWITHKETEIKAAGAEFEGGSMQPMVEYGTGVQLTKERVYQLAKYLHESD